MTRALMLRGYEVLGLTRDIGNARKEYADADDKMLTLMEFDYISVGRISGVIQTFRPNLVFNFAAKATGRGMFDAPQDMSRLNGGFVLDILEGIRSLQRYASISFCQASSSEMYGSPKESPQSEETPFSPRSPYGAAKLYAHNLVRIYRDIHSLRCCSAILYNHESVRRTTDFVTKKIANAAVLIKLGRISSFSVGSLQATRDWGYAPEYVDAMYRMALAEQSADYVVATGRANTVRDLCEAAFGHLGLDYRKYVKENDSDSRITSSTNLLGDPRRIERALGWRAKKNVKDIMAELVDGEMSQMVHST